MKKLYTLIFKVSYYREIKEYTIKVKAKTSDDALSKAKDIITDMRHVEVCIPTIGCQSFSDKTELYIKEIEEIS